MLETMGLTESVTVIRIPIVIEPHRRYGTVTDGVLAMDPEAN
jgi:hypothetical protein